MSRSRVPAYDLTIFKFHCGKIALKIYTKGERVLRIEAVLHNSEELQCDRSLERFPRLVTELKGILERFMNALSSIDQCFIADETLEQLPQPSVVGNSKVGGIDFNKERMRAAGQAVLALAASAGSFTLPVLPSKFILRPLIRSPDIARVTLPTILKTPRKEHGPTRRQISTL